MYIARIRWAGRAAIRLQCHWPIESYDVVAACQNLSAQKHQPDTIGLSHEYLVRCGIHSAAPDKSLTISRIHSPSTQEEIQAENDAAARHDDTWNFLILGIGDV